MGVNFKNLCCQCLTAFITFAAIYLLVSITENQFSSSEQIVPLEKAKGSFKNCLRHLRKLMI